MLSQTFWMLTCTLLVLTLCPGAVSRRGGFGGGRWGGIGRAGVGGGWGGAGAHRGAGFGGGHHYKAHPGSSSSGSSARQNGGAAAAGALGGMVIGHGLGSMSRPGYGYGNSWHGGYGVGPRYGGGYPRYSGGHGNGFTNETDMEYYAGAASRGSTYSYVLLLSVIVSLLIGFWIV